MTNDALIILFWAWNRGKTLRSSKVAGNLRYDKNKLYSYGTCILNVQPMAVFVTSTTYSNTTSRHVRDAIHHSATTDGPLLYVPDPGAPLLQRTFESYAAMIASTVARVLSNRVHMQNRGYALRDLVLRCNDVALIYELGENPPCGAVIAARAQQLLNFINKGDPLPDNNEQKKMAVAIATLAMTNNLAP